MEKPTKPAAVIDIPDVNGAFVGNTLRPFTKEEFSKLKEILSTKKKRSSGKVNITERDLRIARLGHLIAESGDGKSRPMH